MSQIRPLSTSSVSPLVVPLKARVCLCIDMTVDSCDGHHQRSKDVRVKERLQGARSLEYEMSSSIRVANSKPDLSQLLFISARQRELVRVPTITPLVLFLLILVVGDTHIVLMLYVKINLVPGPELSQLLSKSVLTKRTQ